MRVARRLLCLFFLSVTLSLPSVVRAASDLTEEMISADARLSSAKVTVNAPHMYVGELLKLWRKQTGVDLSVGAKDFAADEPVAVFMKDLPLKNAMQALWSLFSYRPGAWNWEREGDAKTGFRYVLHQPFAARQVGATAREAIQKQYENEVASLLAGLKQTPEERKKLSATDPEMEERLNDPSLQNGLAAFAETLSAEDQKKVLNGTSERDGLTKNVSDLGDAGRKFVGDYMQSKRRLNPSQQFDDPTKVDFFTNRQTAAIPTLLVTIGNGSSKEGFSYAGGPGLAAKLAPSLLNLWLMPPDRSTSRQEAMMSVRPVTPNGSSLPPPEQKTQAGNRRNTAQFALRLQQLAESTKTPIIARLPEARRFRSGLQETGEPYGKPLSEFVNRINDWGWGMQHKWRDGTLLIASLTRLTDVPSEDREPWALVKMLRDYQAASPDNTLTLEHIAQITATFPRAQLDNACREEYPSTRYYPPFFYLYDFFRRIGEKPSLLPQLSSPAGCSDPALMAFLVNALGLDTRHPANLPTAVRVTEEKKVVKKPVNGVETALPVHAINLLTLSAQGKDMGVIVFTQESIVAQPAAGKTAEK